MKGLKRLLLIVLAVVAAWLIWSAVQPKAEQPVCPNCGAELVQRDEKLECVQPNCGYATK